VRAEEAVIVPPAAAASVVPPSHLTIDQLSSSDFVTAPAGERFPNNDAKWHRQWAISLAPLFASEALDAASSYGMRELNPLLASPNGGFGTQATGLKFGVIGALAGAEYFLVREISQVREVLHHRELDHGGRNHRPGDSQLLFALNRARHGASARFRQRLP
jgi:hypothetical protein